MPMYTYTCPQCGGKETHFRKILDRNGLAACQSCGEPMDRTLEAPAVRGDYEGYQCPITEKWIEGRAAHKENLSRHGCRVYEPGETAAAQRRKASEDEVFLEGVAETAARSVMTMPAEKREQLARELDSGADAVYSRNSLT